MAIAVEIYITHQDLALSHTIRAVPSATISVVSDAGTDPDHDSYFFEIAAPDFSTVESALRTDHTVSSFTPIIQNGDCRTYRIEYSPEAKLISPLMTDIGAVIVRSESHLDGWCLELRMQDHSGLYDLDEFAEQENLEFDILELRQSDNGPEPPEVELTDAQREALVAAYVHGYYDESSETVLEDLAELLDISQSAVSGRLKRGAAQLIDEVLLDDTDNLD